MGVPKRRASKSHCRKRRAQLKISTPNLIKCPQCHEFTVTHHACASCGYYKGKKVLS
ncbi:MAG TPA: 50S ribosomal protein L32 [Desulfotomaculum sp.]|nr:50S ribosomal protein L32 [Desulfotomaculum sp.]